VTELEPDENFFPLSIHHPSIHPSLVIGEQVVAVGYCFLKITVRQVNLVFFGKHTGYQYQYQTKEISVG
jgi:hypothetical protein